MTLIPKLLVAGVAAIHVYFAYVEMIAWDTKGKDTFSTALDPSLFEPTKVLAVNQGLYNLFLVAGLIWSLALYKSPEWQASIAVFFLLCIVVAGAFGAITTKVMILLYAQAIPAAAALAAMWIWPYVDPATKP